MRRGWIILPVILLAASGVYAGLDGRHYVAYRCDIGELEGKCPVIDGVFADEAWSGMIPEIPLEGNFVSTLYEPTSKDSQFAITYDETKIYFALIAPDLEANPYCGEKDVWRGDGIHINLDIDPNPNNPGTPYRPDYLDHWQIMVSSEGCESSAWLMMVGAWFLDWNPSSSMEIGGAVGQGIEFSS